MPRRPRHEKREPSQPQRQKGMRPPKMPGPALEGISRSRGKSCRCRRGERFGLVPRQVERVQVPPGQIRNAAANSSRDTPGRDALHYGGRSLRSRRRLRLLQFTFIRPGADKKVRQKAAGRLGARRSTDGRDPLLKSNRDKGGLSSQVEITAEHSARLNVGGGRREVTNHEVPGQPERGLSR